MTMANERTEAVVCAGALLIELARDRTLPLKVRQRAATIARHFPTIEDVSSMAYTSETSVCAVKFSQPDESSHSSFAYGPLRESTRLGWPSAE